MTPELSVVVVGGEPARLRTTLVSIEAALRAWGRPAEIVVAAPHAAALRGPSPMVRHAPADGRSTHAAAKVAKGRMLALLAAGDLVGAGYIVALADAVEGAGEAPFIARPKAAVTYGANPRVRVQHGLESDAFRTAGLLFAAPFAPPLLALRTVLASLPDRAWSEDEDWRWTAQTLAMGVRHVAVRGAVHVAWSRTRAADPGPPGHHALFTGAAQPVEITGRLPSWTPPQLAFVAQSSPWAERVLGELQAIACRAEPGLDAPLLALGVEQAPQAIAAARSGRRAAWIASPEDVPAPTWVSEFLAGDLEPVAAPPFAGEGERWDKPARRTAVAALARLGLIPSVSAVLPNFNYSAHLAERLRQIDGQTLPVAEIIVLDDASSDDSVAVVREVAPRLRAPVCLITNAENSGSAFRQWERGARAATGELVWIAEADDMAEPGFLAALAPAFDDPRVLLAQSQSRQIGPQGEVVWEDYSPYLADVGAERWARSFSVDGRAHIAATLTTMNTIPNASAVLFRRGALLDALVEEAGKLADYRLAGDWLVYLAVLAKGRFYFCDWVLNGHRVHPSSVTQSALTPLKRVLEVGRVQAEARSRAAAPPEAVAAATAYLQKLYDWFGLAGPGLERVYDHPDFAPLRPQAQAQA